MADTSGSVITSEAVNMNNASVSSNDAVPYSFTANVADRVSWHEHFGEYVHTVVAASHLLMTAGELSSTSTTASSSSSAAATSSSNDASSAHLYVPVNRQEPANEQRMQKVLDERHIKEYSFNSFISSIYK